ncbi:MAG: hypothetical protein K940chlam7_00151 [Chlamydiae bacterium]|nr:hypothetical protein [Chlamydiota bacterium]
MFESLYLAYNHYQSLTNEQDSKDYLENMVVRADLSCSPRSFSRSQFRKIPGLSSLYRKNSFDKLNQAVRSMEEYVFANIEEDSFDRKQAGGACSMLFHVANHAKSPENSALLKKIEKIYYRLLPVAIDEEWQQSFLQALTFKDRDALWDMRKKIYSITKLASIYGFLFNGKYLSLDPALTKKMQENTKLWDIDTLPRITQERRFDKPQIVVSNQDTFVLAETFLKEGYNPLVLNMACSDYPGGGVEEGASAQEESLFRRSNYHHALNLNENPYLKEQLESKYQISEFGVIYTPNLQVFRGAEAAGYPFIQPFTVNMIASPAYDCRPCGDKPLDKEKYDEEKYVEGMKNKIRIILRCAAYYGHDALVLGAYGCGSFCNNPEEVSTFFQDVFEESEFTGQFKCIGFAILALEKIGKTSLDAFSKQFLSE